MEGEIDYKRYVVLMVEDDKDLLDTYKKRLREWFIVKGVESYDEAMDILEGDVWKGNEIAVVVADYKLESRETGPETGVDFLDEVRKKDPDVGRIVLSAFSESQFLLDAVNNGKVDNYLLKEETSKEKLMLVIKKEIDVYVVKKEMRRLKTIVDGYSDHVIEIKPKEFAAAEKEPHKVMRVIDFDKDKWDTAFYFINRCAYLLDKRYFSQSGTYPEQERVKGLDYTYGYYPDFYSKVRAEILLKRKLDDPAKVNEILDFIVNKEVAKSELAEKLKSYSIEQRLIEDILWGLDDSQPVAEVIQIYLYSPTRVAIIQREPECIVTRIDSKNPDSGVIITRDAVKDGQKVYGELVNEDTRKCRWWYEDGKEVDPKQFLEQLIDKIRTL